MTDAEKIIALASKGYTITFKTDPETGVAVIPFNIGSAGFFAHLSETEGQNPEGSSCALAGDRAPLKVLDLPDDLRRPELTLIALEDVLKERGRQDQKWGIQRHRFAGCSTADAVASMADEITCRGENPTAGFAERMKAYVQRQAAEGCPEWFSVLLEEVFEAMEAAGEEYVRAELVQVVAVAVAMIEDIDSRGNR